MRWHKLLVLLLSVALAAFFQPPEATSQTKTAVALQNPGVLDLRNVKADSVSYRGRKAIRISDAVENFGDNVGRFAIVKGTSLRDGSIEVSLSGDTLPGAPQTARGFVGIAFRMNSDGSQYQCFYLRPKNGRSDDQLQRNHSAQYISMPDSPWFKLRAESPGKYESYVDLLPGAWTKVKIQIAGKEAKLYVNGSDQPTLVVHDLKESVQAGSIALWVDPGTIAHFSNLTVTPAK